MRKSSENSLITSENVIPFRVGRIPVDAEIVAATEPKRRLRLPEFNVRSVDKKASIGQDIVKYYLDENDAHILEFCGSRISGASANHLVCNLILVAYRIFKKFKPKERYLLWTRDPKGARIAIDIWSVDESKEVMKGGQDMLRASPLVLNALEELGAILGVKSRRIIIRHCVRTIGVLLHLENKETSLKFFDKAKEENHDYCVPVDELGRPKLLNVVDKMVNSWVSKNEKGKP